MKRQNLECIYSKSTTGTKRAATNYQKEQHKTPECNAKVFLISTFLQTLMFFSVELGTVALVFNSRTLEAEAGRSLRIKRATWSSQPVPGQPGL